MGPRQCDYLYAGSKRDEGHPTVQSWRRAPGYGESGGWRRGDWPRVRWNRRDWRFIFRRGSSFSTEILAKENFGRRTKQQSPNPAKTRLSRIGTDERRVRHGGRPRLD